MFKDVSKHTAFVVVLSLSQLFATAQSRATANDSTFVAIEPGYNKVSGWHRFWLGESYRKVWAAPVKMRIFHIEKEKGGLTVVQGGGGLQTKSLRLKDRRGRLWVLRTIQKYPERGLPEKLRKTVAKDILQDQVATGHPYAALTVPPFAAALGIPHTNPEIVYVPDDPRLGEYRADFGNSVLLFEEREAVDTLESDNSDKAQEKLREDNDTRIDQKLVLRARLLDLLLGDWDRHEDQWRWERIKDKNGLLYKPMPRDRDKVYYNTSGVLPWVLAHQWLKSNLQGFKENIRDIEGYNFNNRYFDRYFLTALGEEDWREEIKYVKDKITDNLIELSVRLLPDTIFALTGEKIIKTLKARRNVLDKKALEYYRFISKYVDIPASDKHEHFDIENRMDGTVQVAIFKIKKEGTKEKMIYKRVFDPSVTKEVRLYGFGGNDIFSITGARKSPIKVRMLGGADRDSFYVNSDVNNSTRLYVYDRSDEENVLPPRNRAKLRTSTDSSANSFDKHAFKHDQFGPLFYVQYNFDQGLQFRGGLVYEKHGFKKEPYAGRHELYGNYSAGRKAFLFTYTTDLKKVFGNTDLLINVLSRGPHNVSNFYGIGNETKFLKTGSKGMEFYRNRYDYVNADVRLKWVLQKNFALSAGVAGQFYSSSQVNNYGHYLNTYNTFYPTQNVFSTRYYTGLVAGTTFDTRRNLMLPKHGVSWTAEMRAMQEIGGDKKTFGDIRTDISVHIPVTRDSGVVLINRVGAGTAFGKAAYFQQMQLGGIQNLRGYHSSRFTGKTMFYHSIQANIKLFDFTSYLLPGSVGLIGFNDFGRVWVPDEKSNKWHDGYGAGIYVVPADLVLIQLMFGHSAEGTQPYITVGLNL